MPMLFLRPWRILAMAHRHQRRLMMFLLAIQQRRWLVPEALIPSNMPPKLAGLHSSSDVVFAPVNPVAFVARLL